MSVTNIPDKIKYLLWGKAGGRCEYRGCNTKLYIDSLTKVEFNEAYVAHIIADSQSGPRGDAVLSEKLDVLHRLSLILLDREILDSDEIDKVMKGEELPPVEKESDDNGSSKNAVETAGTVKPLAETPATVNN